jgi:replication-associated recombination protein RarA
MSDLFNPSSSTPSQNGFQFPQSLTERYRPATIGQFVGLEKPKRLCARLAENPFDSAWLFVGASGTGKTTMALALASIMPAELHHIPSQECNLESIERIRRTCQYVPRLGCKKHLVLIDEADRMTAAAQLSMLSKLDSTNFPPDTIFILTCNQTDGLEPRFLSRLRTVEFSSYGLASDAAALLESVWKAEAAADAKTPNFARIVKESNNNIRESLLKLETELLLS